MLKDVPLRVGVTAPRGASRVELGTEATPVWQGEKPTTEAMAAEEVKSLRNSIATEVNNRGVAMAQIEQRCSELHAALVADREYAQKQLECMAAQLNRAVTQIEALGSGWPSRGHARSALEAEVSRVSAEIRRVEEEVVRNGFRDLQVRIDEVTQNVPEEQSRANISAMEKHMDDLSTSVREELQRQEERVMVSAVQFMERRLDDFAGGASFKIRSQEGDAEVDRSTITESVNVRMAELATMLREELHRQDALEARFEEFTSSFHDELKRQEDVAKVVIANSLAELEKRFDDPDSLRRQDFNLNGVQSVLKKQEAMLLDQIQKVRDEQSMQESILSGISGVLRGETPYKQAVQSSLGELQIESKAQAAKIDELRDIVGTLRGSVENWKDREKDIWHALDTHTHDVAVDHQKAAAAAAKAATAAAAVPAPPLGSHAVSPAPRLTSTSTGSRTSIFSAVSEPVRQQSGGLVGSASATAVHTSSTAMLRSNSASTRMSSVTLPTGDALGTQPALFTQPAVTGATVMPFGTSVAHTPRIHRESSQRRSSTPTVMASPRPMTPTICGSVTVVQAPNGVTFGMPRSRAVTPYRVPVPQGNQVFASDPCPDVRSMTSDATGQSLHSES